MDTLIANTGIQFEKRTAVINLNQIRKRLYFREWQTPKGTQMELLYYFDNPGVCLSMNELFLNNFLEADKKTLKSQYKTLANIMAVHQFVQYTNNQFYTFNAHRLLNYYLSHFVNKWLPFPYFQNALTPLNWCRVMLSPVGDVDGNGNQDWNLVLAFDTRTEINDGSINLSRSECPVVSDRDLVMKPCQNDIDLRTFAMPSTQLGNQYIAKYITGLMYGSQDMANVPENNQGSRLEFMVAYIYLLSIIRDSFNLGDITLYNDSLRDPIDVTMAVDMGNSKTTAVLVENDDLNVCTMLSLQHFSNPFKETKSPFDMNVTFHKADFGLNIGGSKQFIYPSVLRLGEEATALYYHNEEGFGTTESLSVCSSPKRYLWDFSKSKYEWRFIHTDHSENDIISIDGLTSQFDEKGRFVAVGGGGASFYSRRSLMTFSFIEMLSQANRQLNSDEYRSVYAGDPGRKRRVSRIVLSSPTAMSKLEQRELRKAAAEAQLALSRFDKGLSNQPIVNIEQSLREENVVPSIDDNTWSYDEATCSQMVFLCSEIAHKYANDCERFFNLYGKERSDMNNNGKKVLTVASLDIGAGTTDLMISSYKNSAFNTITPVPLFWESFNIAGDDILKQIIQDVVLEGPNGHISNQLSELGCPPNVITAKLNTFFGLNNAVIPFRTMLLCRKFVRQISIPIANLFLELTRQGCEYKELTWDEIFTTDNRPDDSLVSSFNQHFGFDIESIIWHYSPDVINGIIKVKFDMLLKKISGIMSRYDCDFVICAGRPTSLNQIESMLMQNYPVSPNRLKMLNRYNVGLWYPFQDGNGYFQDQKSIVAVGALLGYYASRGGYKGLHIDISELSQKLLPTTDYFGLLDRQGNWVKTYLTPNQNHAEIQINMLPQVIGCRQIDSDAYPSRPFYSIELSDDIIMDCIHEYSGNMDPQTANSTLRKVKDQLFRSIPIHIYIQRDYFDDKEQLTLESVEDSQANPLPQGIVLQVKSLNESQDFWMDTGEFELALGIHYVLLR